ncbi:MAG: ribbon-helix-helix domain-containing protein [Bryobacteraceae bacterium]
MERTQVQFTPEQIAALRSLSAKTGKPVAELVRLGVDALLRSQRGPDPNRKREAALSAIGEFASGSADGSIEHDRHLAAAFGA